MYNFSLIKLARACFLKKKKNKEHPGLISFRMDWLDLLAVQGTLKSLLQHHSSKASILQCLAFFTVDILGISKLKWTGTGEFNSDDHHIYYCGQESLGRNGVAIMVNKRVRNAVLGCNLKNDRMISVRFQGKPFNHGDPSLCPNQ